MTRRHRDTEQRAEGVERVEAAVEPESELVEVGLQMLGADAVVDAVQPRLRFEKTRWQIGRNSSATSGSPHSAIAWWS